VDALQQERADLVARVAGSTVQVSPQSAGSASAGRAPRGGSTASNGRDTATNPGTDARQGATTACVIITITLLLRREIFCSFGAQNPAR